MGGVYEGIGVVELLYSEIYFKKQEQQIRAHDDVDFDKKMKLFSNADKEVGVQ